MCAWCNIYKYAVLAFVRFYKSQHSSQTPRYARGQTQIAFYPPVPLAQLAALIPVTGVIPKQNKGEGRAIGFISRSRQSKHSFKELISGNVPCFQPPCRRYRPVPVGGRAASPRTAVPPSCTPPCSVPAEPGTAAWCQRHPGPGDPAAGGPRATRATHVHVRWGGERRSAHPHPCAVNEWLPSLAADNEDPLLITHEVLIGWPWASFSSLPASTRLGDTSEQKWR